ncbi:hypothetical protein [Faecalicatena contorta]|uniref:hypothetical protein n=1 Tax=Faecalicatena contorta TaxID=39482 RepID=UPI00129D9426|nr:hypothetical protein [Faecalicatena contorta]GKH33494.1 hypothetical protein CE91St64_29010 [Faecalicatena contorta]
MTAKEMEIKQVHQMITDCWRLYKEYFSKDLIDDELEQIRDEACELAKKYENHSFANAMICAVVNELGEIGKRKR